MKKIYNFIKTHPVFSFIGISFIYLFVIILLLIFSYNIGHKKGYKKGYNDCLIELEAKYSTPVERVVIDSLYINRDSIIYRTKYIKQIQHDTTEKVYNLDNSSTLDLFYELVNE